MLKSEDLVQLVDYSRNDTVPELVRAAEEERAAVVAWLRELGAINAMLPPCLGVADDIENGEHRREEVQE